ncbi:MAG: hypothetical protein OJF60_002955 [Burkholderiaceae bacterium]|nr:MAG: hypothetical protein OJF60_002955 [Burkholderiaceae bacterium]
MPENDAGMRIEPAWSAPIARSTSPATSSAALPVLEPPGVWPGLRGLMTGPVALVALPPENEKYSHTDLPTISPPASRMRVTIIASPSGTWPSRIEETPFIIGTPATQTLSLIASRLPASLPVAAPWIRVRMYQALYGLSAGSGRVPGVRGYFTGSGSSGRRSTRRKSGTNTCANSRNSRAYSSLMSIPRSAPSRRTMSLLGSSKAIGCSSQRDFVARTPPESIQASCVMSGQCRWRHRSRETKMVPPSVASYDPSTHRRRYPHRSHAPRAARTQGAPAR